MALAKKIYYVTQAQYDALYASGAKNGTVTVDVRLTAELPKGARPDLSVDGTIELERLTEVLYVGRPAFGSLDRRG